MLTYYHSSSEKDKWKLQWDTSPLPLRWLEFKRPTIPWITKQPEMYIAGKNAILEKTLTMPTEVIHALSVNPSNPISKNKNIYSYKYYNS